MLSLCSLDPERYSLVRGLSNHPHKFPFCTLSGHLCYKMNIPNDPDMRTNYILKNMQLHMTCRRRILSTRLRTPGRRGNMSYHPSDKRWFPVLYNGLWESACRRIVPVPLRTPHKFFRLSYRCFLLLHIPIRTWLSGSKGRVFPHRRCRPMSNPRRMSCRNTVFHSRIDKI